MAARRSGPTAGVSWGLIDVNPAKQGIDNPQRRYTEKRPFESWAELEALAAELGPRYGPLVLFAAATGLRPGEWIALEQRDIDREARVVYVRRALTLAGESMGATVSLTAATALEDRVRRVAAFNTYDYPKGVGRANRIASIYVGSARLPVIGPVVTRMENKPVLGIVLRGGLFDGSKLPNHYLVELRRVGRRPEYPRVAREVFRNVDSMVAARALYGRVTAPVTLIYGDHDWSHPSDREANLALLPGARSISLPET